MNSRAMTSGDRTLAAIISALVFHGAALGLLHTADGIGGDDWDDETEVEIVAPPEPEPEPPKPEPPKPEPVEPVVEKVEKVVVKERVAPKPVRSEPTTKAPIVADEPDDETASGDPDLPAPGGIYKMEDVAPGGTAMGGVGSSKSSGKGGSGSGTAAGGDGGTGKGKKPVSIASIKKKAIPINNRDVIGDRRFNDVTGNVVVKLIVDANGKVTKTTLIRRLKPEVDKVALAWAKKLKFKPAIDQDDKPVVSVVTWTFTFRPPT